MIRQVVDQEEGDADLVLRITDLAVDVLQEVDQPVRIVVFVRVEPFQHFIFWVQTDEGETPPQRMIHQSNGAVSGVHRTDEAYIVRDLQAIASSQWDGFVAVFQQIHQLAEHTRQIGAINLVDNKYADTLAILRFLAECQETPWFEEVFQRTVFRLGSNALHEVFVGIGRMELNEFHEAIAATDQMLGQLAGDESFSRSRRAVQNGLALALGRADPVLDLGQIEAGILRDLFQWVFRLNVRWWQFYAKIFSYRLQGRVVEG